MTGRGACTGAPPITCQPRIVGVFIYPDTDSARTTAYADKNTTFETNGAMGLEAYLATLTKDARYYAR